MMSLRDRRLLHRCQLPLGVVALLLQAAALMQVSASGVFQLEVGPWTNELGVTADGSCCEGGTTVSVDGTDCPGPCRTFLRVCLGHYQAVAPDTSDCTYGSVVTGADQFTDLLRQSSVEIPFEFAWPGSFSVVVEAWHDDTGDGPSPGSRRTLIWRLTAQRLLNSSGSRGDTSWTSDELRPASPLLSAVLYRYRAVCDVDFYGPGCSEFCRPRDDRFGHYDCKSTGSKVCHSGWTGTYCHTPVCRNGCRGYCREPFECRCRQGWTGDECDQCLTKPGCQHGYCVEPWQCICNQGWTGAYCNHELDLCSAHQPCQHGATCRNDGHGGYTCVCGAGFSGTDCERDLRDCRHRQLSCLQGANCQYNADVGRYECRCLGGRVGGRCQSLPGCHHQQPCHNGGVCVDEQQPGVAARCLCPSGFTGRFCDVDIDDCASQPCVNGRCVDERDGFRCVCALGYSGSRCDVDVDDCEKLRGPCLNGGACVDGLDTFSCRCPAGFRGSLCEFRCRDGSGPSCADNVVEVEDTSSSTSDVDCLSSPCLNGATCVDVDDATRRFRCVCRREFRGRRCHIDVAKRRHSKHRLSTSTTVSTTFNASTLSSHSADLTASSSSATEQALSINSRQSLIVVVSPVGPVILAAAVAAAVALTGTAAVCICWYRRRRRHDMVHRPCHHGVNASAAWIHNDVKRQNNISNCRTVAKIHDVSDRL